VHYTHPVVHDIKDRKFWKQITTLRWAPFGRFKVVHDIKDRKFWKQITTLFLEEITAARCSRHQRSKILKANHNSIKATLEKGSVVHDIKDRKFWKQITTLGINSFKMSQLFTTSKIENFESKSQRYGQRVLRHCCCSRHQRSKILKANHNILRLNYKRRKVVHDIKDRKFWKQITTSGKWWIR